MTGVIYLFLKLNSNILLIPFEHASPNNLIFFFLVKTKKTLIRTLKINSKSEELTHEY